MRSRDSSAHARKICEPGVRLKLFRRMHSSYSGVAKVIEIRHLFGLYLYLKFKTVPPVIRKRQLFIITFLVLAGSFFQAAMAQQGKRIVQLSGVVVEEDSISGRPLAGVYVYVPKAGRGTTSNSVGFFSMPVLPNDEVVISLVGFKRQTFRVPENAPEYQTIIVTLVQDSTMLPEVVIVPFPTEEVFKEAVLALNLPKDNIDPKNLNQELLALILKTTPMDGSQNHRFYLDQMMATQNAKFQPVTNPFLNPFNWVKFFNGLKKNKKK
jgi:hypothetical protein